MLYDTSLDRCSQRECPKESRAGFQIWKDLLFLHWEIPIPQAQRFLPKGMELDLYDNKAWIGLVPFAMEEVRPWWLPPFAAFSFLETNVRLYVIWNGEPGVLFLSLDAASWLAVQAARWGWGLPYFYAQMHMNKKGHDLSYASKRASGVLIEVDYTIGDHLGESLVGSAEFFFLERYLLFVERNGKIYRGQVHHTPYRAHRASVHNLKETLTQSHGFSCLGSPTFVHASPGVEVDIYPLKQTKILLS